MRQLTLSLALAASALASCGGGDSDASQKFTASVFGDVPYGTSPTDTAQLLAFPGYIQSINTDPDVSVVLHAGDLHSGKQYCTQAFNQAVFNAINSSTRPLVYTPGDNEWADCHKVAEGGGTWNQATSTVSFVADAAGKQVDYAGGNPVDNLALVRSMFFPSPGKTLGTGSLPMHSQALEFDPAFPTDAQFVENTWFIKSGVLVVAINIPGGSNNGVDPWYGAPTQSADQLLEVSNRTGATQRWLKTAFDQANSNNVSAIVILEQADMWDADGKDVTHIAGYKPYLDTIAARTLAFGRPVLMFNGDSHVYRSDNPMVKGAACVIEPTSGAAAATCTADAYNNQPNGYNVPNFHRVTVHGSTFPLEWLKLTIDPAANAAQGSQAFGPFSWQRVGVK